MLFAGIAPSVTNKAMTAFTISHEFDGPFPLLAFAIRDPCGSNMLRSRTLSKATGAVSAGCQLLSGSVSCDE